MRSPLSRLVFLVVDDNDHMVQIVRTILRGFGASALLSASDAPTAFALAREQDIDFIFADYNLGMMDGVAFTRLMRTAADSPRPYVPIVMISAHSELFRVEAARDAGATDFLVKPLSPLEIHRKIMDAIERPRPFVRSGDFFGPDRRRRRDPLYEGPERRVAAGPDDGEDAVEAPGAATA